MPILTAESLLIDCGVVPACRTASFALDAAQVIWVRGRSGEGKTTLLRTLSRLIPVTGGEMSLQGISWREIPATVWRTTVVYVHQKPVLFPGNVESNLLRAFSFQSRSRGHPDLAWASEAFSRLLLPEDVIARDALTLSVGEGCRVALVRALMLNPTVLLLDEPSAALDAKATEAVAGLLRDWLDSGARGIIAAGHDEGMIGLLPGQEILLADPLAKK